MAVVSGPDVPGDVMAALAHATRIPADPPPEDPGELAAWWRDTATAHDVRAAAYERLYAWQSMQGRHRAELQATTAAVDAARASAWEARRTAMEIERDRRGR